MTTSCSQIQTVKPNITQDHKAIPNVLLIHGVLMSSLEMHYLGKQLEKLGFRVHYISYQSIQKTPTENAEVIHDKIQKLQLSNLHIVAHSLGGIIVTHLFDQFDDIPEGRVVMLGSPINGSWVAKKFEHWPILSRLLDNSMQGGLSGEDIPEWEAERDWGMIAGTRNQGLGLILGGLPKEGDGTVMLQETVHPQQTQHLSVKKSHTGLVFSKQVAHLTAHFLRNGQFTSQDNKSNNSTTMD